MIRLGNEYGITADGNGYAVEQIRVTGPESKEPGKEYTTPISYHATVDKCIKAIIGRMCRGAVAECDMTLGEAAEKFREIEERVYEWAKIGEGERNDKRAD
ncbi:MAG: hypothetical protein WC047_00165 [Kiritimatiellales bacterium]